MKRPEIRLPKPADPFAPEIAACLASKRLQAQRAERPRTPPVVKDEPTVAYVEEAEIYQIAERNHWFATDQGGMM